MRFSRRVVCVGLLSLSALASFAATPGTDLILPVAGRVSGGYGSEFYTSVWISNTNDSPSTVQIQFAGAGREASRVTTTLAPGETRSYENITEQLFAAPGVLGSLRFRSSDEILVAARIYNRNDGAALSESQGAAYTALPAEAAIGAGQSAHLQGVAQDLDYRYNVFVAETRSQFAGVTLSLIDAAGEELGSREYLLQPDGFVSVNVRDMDPSFSGSGARLRAEVTSGTGGVVLAGSMTTNGSQDPTGYDMSVRAATITAGVTSLNGLTGALTLTGGANVSIIPSGDGFVISADTVPGPEGPQGPRGAQGPRGLEGPAGVQGPTGAKGVEWRGVWSSTAAYGRDEAVSHAGSSWIALNATANEEPGASASWSLLASRGAIGPEGPVGATGATGPAGPQGDPGPEGPAGPQGAQGVTGATGPAGPEGPQGPAGPQGLQGSTGPAGPTGATGPAGPQGDEGPQGPVGPQGLQGLTGATGATGATGPAGPQGDEGPQGPVGPQGPQGLTGATGLTGPQGPQGLDGPQGIEGPEGLVWRGSWSAGDSYVIDDAVQYDGASWIALAANVAEQPGSGASWSLLAAQGATGPVGPAGSVGALAGDVTGDPGTTVVALVGGEVAADVAAATVTVSQATDAADAGTLVLRDASGNFSAGTITATLDGHATSATDFTGSLAGDVTGAQSSTQIAAGAVGTSEIENASILAGDIAGSQVVKSLNGLTDAVTLVEGSGVTITPGASQLTIAAPGTSNQSVTFNSSGTLSILDDRPATVTSGNAAWLLGGNATTAATRFGTTTSQHVDLITNGTVRGRLSNLGELFIGTTSTALTGDLMNAVGSATFPWAVNGYTSFNGGGVYGAIQGANTTQFAAVQGENSSTSGNYNSAAVRGINSSTVAGTGFRTSAASGPRMGVAGNVSGTGSYSFGVHGTSPSVSTRTGGLFGDDGGWAMGAVGYYASDGNDYSFYAFGNSTLYDFETGTAPGSLPPGESSNRWIGASSSDGRGGPSRVPNSTIGLGVYGALMGGWIRGSVYGMHVKGGEYSLYVDGQSFTNTPTINLVPTSSGAREVTYTISSTTPDIYTRGRTTLQRGAARVTVPAAFRASMSSAMSLRDAGADVVITVTPLGESKGVYIESMTDEGFIIRENGGGESTVEVSWIAIASRTDVQTSSVPEALLAADFDEKMNRVMHHEDDPSPRQTFWWDGEKVRFDGEDERDQARGRGRPSEDPAAPHRRNEGKGNGNNGE